MEYLSPHIIMRNGLIDGVKYPRFAETLAEFMAATLFKTSDLYLPAGEKKRRIAVFCANTELCKITEDLVFTDPYRDAKLNHWTSPQLDDIALEFRSDGPLKAAAQAMKLKFLSSAEALVHGDLHSGSIMATTGDIRVIDPEFAFFGPMGFDVGALIANLILAYLSQIGHEAAPGARDEYRAWILGQTIDVWNRFAARFVALWNAEGRGDAYTAELFADPAGRDALAAEQERYMRRLFSDTLRVRRLQDDPTHPRAGPCRRLRDDRQQGSARQGGAQGASPRTQTAGRSRDVSPISRRWANAVVAANKSS